MDSVSKEEAMSVAHDGLTPFSSLALQDDRWEKVVSDASWEITDLGADVLAKRPEETSRSALEIRILRKDLQTVGLLAEIGNSNQSKYPAIDQLLEIPGIKEQIEELRKSDPQKVFDAITVNKTKQTAQYFIRASTTEIEIQAVKESTYTSQITGGETKKKDKFECLSRPPVIKDNILEINLIEERNGRPIPQQINLHQPCPSKLAQFLLKNWDEVKPGDPELEEILKEQGLKIEKPPTLKKPVGKLKCNHKWSKIHTIQID